MDNQYFDQLLKLALLEDLGSLGDVTSRSIFSNQKTLARLVSKDSGVLCGTEYFKAVFSKIDPLIQVRFLFSDGDLLSPGDLVAQIEGPACSVLESERIALNFLSFLSGIATTARSLVEAASESGNSVILDTRKTLPGYRHLSKYAVLVGGGKNHRMGLHDMVMIKDNHIDACGSITEAVKRVRDKWNNKFRIEVECRTLEDVREALGLQVDVIMLDNMTPQEAARCLEIRSGETLFESSGNMTLERIAQYSRVGVDFISVGGALTQSVNCFDFSLQIGGEA